MPRRCHAARIGAGIRAGRANSLPPASSIRSPDPPRLDGTTILLSGICVLPNGDCHGCRHPIRRSAKPNAVIAVPRRSHSTLYVGAAPLANVQLPACEVRGPVPEQGVLTEMIDLTYLWVKLPFAGAGAAGSQTSPFDICSEYGREIGPSFPFGLLATKPLYGCDRLHKSPHRHGRTSAPRWPC